MLALQGLNSEAVETSRKVHGINELSEKKKTSLLSQIWEVIKEPMLLLLVAAGLISFLIADLLEAGMLFAMVLIVIAISVYQTGRTEKALAALRDMSAPSANVIRNGEIVLIPSREVVVGDILLLQAGDRVAADGYLLESHQLFLDESLLTGESLPVSKQLEQGIFAGTLVTSGSGVAEVTLVGEKTSFGSIGAHLRDIDSVKTPLQQEISDLVKLLATFAFIAVGLVTVLYYLTRSDLAGGLLVGIATAMSMIPEEFPVVLTVFMAMGAWRLTQSAVISRKPMVIETLGAATIICVDKTGTLTMNQMSVTEITNSDATILDTNTEHFQKIVTALSKACAPNAIDPMDKAILSLTTPSENILQHIPIEDSLLVMGNVYKDNSVTIKGAPELVMEMCGLSEAKQRPHEEYLAKAANRGMRVLAVAEGTLPTLDADLRSGSYSFIGMASFSDPVRTGVADAIKTCNDAGIKVIMITGDHPNTARYIAESIGIPAEHILTGKDIDEIHQNELATKVSTTRVFARMLPHNKLRLVQALKSNNEIVAMTGDGVNDAPALKSADIGIAMGKRGTEVAREAASLVIADDDFTTLVRGIKQGRGIYSNLRKAMVYILAIHVPLLGLALTPVLNSAWPILLLPIQIAFIELIIDPACSVVFESEEFDPNAMLIPPRRREERILNRRTVLTALSQGTSVLISLLVLYFWLLSTALNDESIKSIVFTSLVFSNLMLILINRSWVLSIWQTLRQRGNPTIKWIFSIALLLLVSFIQLPLTREVFGFGVMTLSQWILSFAVGVLPLLWFEAYKLLQKNWR
ncbi:MAG: cation-translocating P-type ATPase [Candidatus Nanopelagicales bacterium]